MLRGSDNSQCGVAFATTFLECPAGGTPVGSSKDFQLARLARDNAKTQLQLKPLHLSDLNNRQILWLDGS